MRVGTSYIRHCINLGKQDHPHACGDKFTGNTWTANTIGSSPCVWGQGDAIINIDMMIRIIPMRVGTRTAAHIRYTLREDHPHACGDKR